jgi:hypothetical protein
MTGLTAVNLVLARLLLLAVAVVVVVEMLI